MARFRATAAIGEGSPLDTDVAVGLSALSGGESVAIVRDGVILASASGAGIRPFLLAAAAVGRSPAGSTLVDRVVGRAVALISLHYGIDRVHAGVLSQLGLDVLVGGGVAATYDRLVPFILNRTGDDLCPIEKMVMHLTSPERALCMVRAFVGLD